MIVFLKVLFVVFMGIASYFISEAIITANLNDKVAKYINKKNEQYYRDLQIYYTKNKKIKVTTKLNILHKLDLLIEKASLKRGLFLNAITILFLCVL